MRWLLCFFILACAPQIEFPAASQQAPASLQIYALDVGQGDATLIVTPQNQIILIDAGKPDAGYDVILPALSFMGITSIDYLFVSHYDADHLGGVPEILRGPDRQTGTNDDIPIGTIYDYGAEPFTPSDLFKDYVSLVESARKTLDAGISLDLEKNLQIECLYSDGKFPDETQIALESFGENARSLVLELKFGAFTYFTAGDLPGGGLDTFNVEEKLLPWLEPVDVLHVSHHGSQSSTSNAFLEKLKPKASLISLGEDNDYGHPHPDVMNRLWQHDIEIYLTSDGDGVYLPEAHIVNSTIQIKVKSDGSFEVF